MTDIQEDVADNKANAPAPTTEEDVSEENNNSQETTESETKTESLEAENAYLGDNQPEKGIDWRKRYEDSDKEFNTNIKPKLEKATQYEQALANLEKLAQANPRILAEIEAAQGLANQGGFSNSPFNNPIFQQQINQALGPIKKIAQDLQDQDKKAKAQAFIEFEKRNPGIFPVNSSEDQKNKVRGQIGRVVNALTETGMSFKEALNRAALTVNPDAAIQRGKDEAYTEILSEEQAGFSSQSPSEGKRSKKTFTPGELKAAEKLGVKEALLKDK